MADLVFIALALGINSYGQTATLRGVVLDKNNKPVGNVNVFSLKTKK